MNLPTSTWTTSIFAGILIGLLGCRIIVGQKLDLSETTAAHRSKTTRIISALFFLALAGLALFANVATTLPNRIYLGVACAVVFYSYVAFRLPSEQISQGNRRVRSL